MSESRNSQSRWPPFGVALLSLLYFGVAAALLISLIPDPPVPTPSPMPENYFCFDCGGHDPWQYTITAYVLVLGLLMLASAVGTLIGFRVACIGLLFSVALFGCLVLYETYGYVRYVVAVEQPEELSSLSFWWQLLDEQLLWALWIALNCWYLLGKRTAWYFALRANTQSHA